MACRDSRGGVILASVGVLVFVMSLCNCAKLTRLKGLDKSRETTVHTKNQRERGHLRHGKLLIGQKPLKAAKLHGTNATEVELDVEDDYQADMGWQTQRLMQKNDWEKMAMDSLLKMESKVECTQDSMKLLVQDAASTPASLIFVDRGHLSPLSLTKLPSSCGYTIRSTQNDLVLVAPYDGCFVIIQENYYVLPLLWWGLPVRMSCPLMGHLSQNPPMVTCHAEGMVVRTEWTTSASQIKVNVNGNWESLLTAAQRCVFGIVEHPEGVVITVHYAPCLEKKDGMYSLELAADVETKASCPSLLAAQLKLPQSQVKGSMQDSNMPGKWLYPFPTPYPSLTLPPAQGTSQSPNVFQNPRIPNKPHQGSAQFPNYMHLPGFPSLQNPDITPTKPQTPKPSKSKVIQSVDPFFHQFYPQLPFPAMPPTTPPVTKSDDDGLRKELILPLEFPQKPPASYPEFQEWKFYLSHYAEVLSQLPNSYPLYLQRLPGPSYPTGSEKGQGERMPFHLICSADSKPSGLSQLPWPDIFKGEVQQLFQLVCVQTAPASKPIGVFKPAHSDSTNGQVYKPFNLLCTLHSSQPQNSKTPQGHIYSSFYLFCYQQKQASNPVKVAQQPQEPPKGHLYQAFYPFFQSSQKPTGANEPPQPVTPQAKLYPPLFPFFNQPPQKPAVTLPPNLGTPQAQIHPELFPFYPLPKPTEKPKTSPQHPTTHREEMFPPIIPFYLSPKQTEKPATWPPQPGSPQAQVYPQLFPFYAHPIPTQQPATRPQQPATPQTKVYPQLFSYYSYPIPTRQPASRPQQPATPQSQVYPQLFPFYAHPIPTQQPATRPQQPATPPQQATPQTKVYPQLFSYYSYPIPTRQPASGPQQPATPQSQVYPQLFPFYPFPAPMEKPATRPQQTATPRAQMYPPYFNQPQSHQKPAATLPPQPVTPQAQAYLPFYYFYTQPTVTQKPTVTQTPQTTASQSKVSDHFSDAYSKQKPPPKPTAVNQPQQLQHSKGQVSKPLYPYHLYSKSTARPTAEPHLLQPQNPKGQGQQRMCFYSQLLAENQPPNIPTNTAQGQLYGPCQQSILPAVEISEDASIGHLFPYSKSPVANTPQGQVKKTFNILHYSQQPQSAQLSSAASMQQLAALASEQKIDSFRSEHGYPVYCPQYCPSGLSNCCLQIAFHQHVYISVPRDGKPEPQFDKGFPPVSYAGFSQGLETENPQKLSSAALQTAETSTSEQISQRSPQTPEANKYFFQPPGGIAALPISSLGMMENKEPVYSYFRTESPNPLWTHGGQGKSESPKDPSKLWPSVNEVKPVVQYEPFNQQFPEQTIHSRPNFMSYLGQNGPHVREQQNNPATDQLSLHRPKYRSLTHHNFKRAIDRFFSPYYMPGDSPVFNGSVGLNSSQEQPSESGSSNSQEHKTQTLPSESQSYKLLQHGPPGREPKRFSDSHATFEELTYGSNSEASKPLRQNADPLTLESKQEKGQGLTRLGKGIAGNGYMDRDDSSGFTLLSDDSNPMNLNPEQSFSAEQLKPEVLESFEDLWKSQTPSEFSQWFLATEMDKLRQMDKPYPKEK